MDLDAMDIDIPSSVDSSMEDVPNSPSTETGQHWRKIARKISMRELSIRQEYNEYKESSTAYESEIESMLRQTEQINQKLRRANDVLEADNKQLRDKLNSRSVHIDALESEIQSLRVLNDNLTKHNRRLEQENDDLERANRETKVTEEEKEWQLNETLEKLALLETEVDEKESLLDAIQRLKDENRDLMQQLKIERNPPRTTSCENFASADKHVKHETCERSTSLLKFVNEKQQQIESWDKLDRINKISQEGWETKQKNVEKILTFETEKLSAKKNFKVVIEQLKENKNTLPRKRQTWLFSSRKKSSAGDNREDEHHSSDSECLDDRLKKRAKVVKDELERQQKLKGFLDQLHFSRPRWMRKKKDTA